MKLQIIHFSDLTPTTWSGGLTYEYLISPPNASYALKQFAFRLSSATIEVETSTFTQFEGFHRYLIMIDAPLVILHNGIKKSIAPQQLFSFDSNDTVQSFSKGSDFNFMVAHQYPTCSLTLVKGTYHPTTSQMYCFALEAGTWKISGKAYSIASKDLILLENVTHPLIFPFNCVVIAMPNKSTP